MIFSNRTNYGISEELFLNAPYKSFINFASVKTDLGYTPGNATSISYDKKLAIKKCYSEYIERYAMGLSINKEDIVNSYDLIEHSTVSEAKSHFSYGDTIIGHSDTTGTAAGIYSVDIINKGLCELIEKNDLMCFWYGNGGSEIANCDIQKLEYVRKMGLISDEIRLFTIKEISNYPTVIAMGFKLGKLITTGICCSKKIQDALYGAVKEAKVIEWQQYNNSGSPIWDISEENQRQIKCHINRPIISLHEAEKTNSMVDGVAFASWIKSIRIKVIFSDARYNLKAIKSISDELMISVPTISNIKKCLEKEVVRRYYINNNLDCPIL